MHRALPVLLFFLPAVAVANLIWPALYLTGAIYVWWVMAIGLLVEFIVIRRLFRIDVRRAALVDVAANAVSGVAGIVLIPLAGVIYEIFPGILINAITSWGTFNPIGWVSTVFLAAAVNVAVEGQVMKRVFNLKLSNSATLVLFAANLFTVSLAFLSMLPHMKMRLGSWVVSHIW